MRFLLSMSGMESIFYVNISQVYHVKSLKMIKTYKSNSKKEKRGLRVKYCS